MATFKCSDGINPEPYLLDLDTLMIAEALELKRLTGLGPRAWLDDLAEDDPLACRFAFYLARRRAGEEVAFADVDANLFGMSFERVDEEAEPAPGITDEATAEMVPTSPAPEPTTATT